MRGALFGKLLEKQAFHMEPHSFSCASEEVTRHRPWDSCSQGSPNERLPSTAGLLCPRLHTSPRSSHLHMQNIRHLTEGKTRLRETRHLLTVPHLEETELGFQCGFSHFWGPLTPVVMLSPHPIKGVRTQ